MIQVEKLNQFVSTLAKVAYHNNLTPEDVTQEFRKQYVMVVLERNNFNQTKAARELREHRNTFIRRLQRLGIDASGMRRQKRIVRRAALLAKRSWEEK